MTNRFHVWVAAAIAVGMVAGAPLRAMAQDDVRDKIIPTLEVDQMDIRDALRMIFKDVGASYSLSSDVVGSVTASLTNVSFETALRNLLNQVGATYRTEGTVYVIFNKPVETGPLTGTVDDTTLPTRTQALPRRIQIRHADPYLIYVLLNGTFDITSLQPETSTMVGGGGMGGGGGFGGMGGGMGGMGGGGFGGGGFGGGGMGGMGGGGFGGGGMGGFGGGGMGGMGGGGFGGGGRGGF